MYIHIFIHSYIHTYPHTLVCLYIFTAIDQFCDWRESFMFVFIFNSQVPKRYILPPAPCPPPVLFICCFLLALCSLYSFKHFQIIWYIIHTNANAFTTTSPLSPSRPHRYLRTSFIKECVCPSPILTKLTHKHTHIHTYTYMLIKFFMYYQQTCVCSMPTFVHMY